MEKQGKLIVFSAPSGSGKTTLVKHLLTHQELPLAFSISATSRLPRKGETDHKDYHFLSPKKFQEAINEDHFIEYEEVYKGTFYGTLKSELARIWKSGKHVLFDIDVKGGLNIKKQYPERTLAVFVQPPNLKVLKKRLRHRATETEDKIQQRLEKSAAEMTYAGQFDLLLVNDDLATAKKQVVQLVKDFIDS